MLKHLAQSLLIKQKISRNYSREISGIFFARPRQFGKSSRCSTLEALFRDH